MVKNTLSGLDKKKLRRWLLLFFFALAIPTAILIQQSYSRLKWETFHQHQLQADELSNRIDNEFLRLINIEEQRSFTDYSFLNIAGDPKASLLQRSPLSNYPLESEIAGLIGYFQIDNQGKLKTPLLPENIQLDKGDTYGITDKELQSRTQLQQQIVDILSQNSLVKNTNPIVSKDRRLNEIRKNQRKTLGATKQESESMFSGMVGASSTASSDYAGASNDAMLLEKKREVPNAQIAFDRLKTTTSKRVQSKNQLGRVEDLKLNKSFSKESQKQKVVKTKRDTADKSSKRARTEQNVLPEGELFKEADEKKNKVKPNIDSAEMAFGNEELTMTASAPVIEKPKPTTTTLRIRTFESSIDPFAFSQLDSGHFVLFRNVWLDDKRYIQGLLIEQKIFLENIVNKAFRNTSLSQMSDLLVSYQGDVLSTFIADAYTLRQSELNGELLYQTRLSDPLSELQLLFSVRQLPVGAGGKIIAWLSVLLASVLCGGFYLMYRLGLGQINLANQQQDFVSAVSHELKTPLTSIRMYSEMLREGWASEEKKKTYYDFIFDESERLSRLINNVLHLARVTRNKQTAELNEISVAELMDGVRSKVSTQIKHAGFELAIQCDKDAEQTFIKVDADWFIQIMINLVDNAIKFSAKANIKKIDLKCEKSVNNIITFTVRDYGPGIDKTQMEKVFNLFYRTESELTRETVGTGIGLALVHQMAVSMDGKINVANKKPGAEFSVEFTEVSKR